MKADAPRPLVDVQDLSVRFVSRDAAVNAVNGVSFTLDRGEALVLLGDRALASQSPYAR